jgi:hypothetical protein
MIPIFTVYVLSCVYAVVRYVAFTPKYADHIPAFIMNKGISMAAVMCLSLGFVAQWRRTRGVLAGPVSGVEPGLWFRAGVFGAIWHIPLALAILRPAYFKEFFVDAGIGGADGLGPRLSTAGELIFFFGGLAAGLIFLLLRPQMGERARWWASVGAMGAALAHVVSMGVCRGVNIKAQYGYLPPMWLISAVGIALGLVVLMFGRRR